MGKRQSFTRAFKLEAVRLLEKSGRPIAQVARELGVRRNQLYKWHEQLQRKGPDEVFPGPGRRLGRAAELVSRPRVREGVGVRSGVKFCRGSAFLQGVTMRLLVVGRGFSQGRWCLGRSPGLHRQGRALSHRTGGKLLQ